jgi:L-2-hydroxyglutarate oxidase LhgO
MRSLRGKHDFLVVGAGVVGIAIARALRRAYPSSSIAVLEKAASLGADSSGRNSGVMHAGFYYTANSLKAQFCRRGNAMWREFCQDNDVSINPCGKLVVAKNASELSQLDVLFDRAKANGVHVQRVTAKEAEAIEPLAATYEYALWSPATFSLSPTEALTALFRVAQTSDNVDFYFSTGFEFASYDEMDQRWSITAHKDGIAVPFSARYIVNAAGLYADHIAHRFGVGLDYTLLPFKGLYLKHVSDTANPEAGNRPFLKTNIYPVPDLRNPFLGVHFTVTADGSTKIGPTAVPALWRRQYGPGLANFQLSEFRNVVSVMTRLAFQPQPTFKFWSLAAAEVRKYSKHYLLGCATSLLDPSQPLCNAEMQPHKWKWTAPGIRAQLFSHKTRTLEMDFVVRGDNRSMHVLNAVSPAFTCAFPFAEHVVAQIQKHVSQ